MQVNDVINGYRLVRELPCGGMALVFVVEKGGKQYALKTPKHFPTDEFLKRFSREVRIMQNIHNDYVLEILDCDLDAAEPYYIMPLCESSLDNLIPLMDHAERIQACIDLSIGIKALHDADIRHRDIKPSNALLLGGQLKISDLGLGRMVDRDTTTMTTTHARYTPAFMPPEYDDNPETFRQGTIEGDIFMLGKSIYNICSGGGNPLYVDDTKIDPSVYAIIDKCTKIRPAERYHHVDDVLNALIAVRSQQQMLAKQPLPIEEILKNRNLIDFESQVYNLLLAIGNNNTEMDRVLRKLTTEDLYRVFKANKLTVPDFIKYFVESIRNAQYSIQFTEIDEYARISKVLISVCDDNSSKRQMLQFLIDFAKGYNRFYAMEVVGDILANIPDETIQVLAPFLKENQEDLIDIKPYFKVTQKGYVKDLLEKII